MLTSLPLIVALVAAPDPLCDVVWGLTAVRESDRTTLNSLCLQGLAWNMHPTIVHAVVASLSWQTSGLFVILDKMHRPDRPREVGLDSYGTAAEQTRAQYAMDAEVGQVQQFLDHVVNYIAMPNAADCRPLLAARQRYLEAVDQCRLGACASPPYLVTTSDLRQAAQRCPGLPQLPAGLSDYRFLTVHTDAVEHLFVASATGSRYVLHWPTLAEARRIDDNPVVVVPILVNAPYSVRIKMRNNPVPRLQHGVATMDPPSVGLAPNMSCLLLDASAPGGRDDTTLWLDGTMIPLREDTRHSLIVADHDHQLTAVTCRRGGCFIRFSETLSAGRLRHSQHLCTPLKVHFPADDTIGLLATRVEDSCVGIDLISGEAVKQIATDYMENSDQFQRSAIEDLDENIRLSEELARAQERNQAPVAVDGRISEPWSFSVASTSLREVWRQGVSDLLVLKIRCPARRLLVEATRISLRQYFASDDDSMLHRTSEGHRSFYKFTTKTGPREALIPLLHTAINGTFGIRGSRLREGPERVLSVDDPDDLTLDSAGAEPLRVHAKWLGLRRRREPFPLGCEEESLRRPRRTPIPKMFGRDVAYTLASPRSHSVVSPKVKYPGVYRVELRSKSEDDAELLEDTICVDYRHQQLILWPTLELWSVGKGLRGWREEVNVKAGLGFTYVPPRAPRFGVGLEVDYLFSQHSKLGANSTWTPTPGSWNSQHPGQSSIHEFNLGGHVQFRQQRPDHGISLVVQGTFNVPVRFIDAGAISTAETFLRQRQTGRFLRDVDLSVDVRVGMRVAFTPTFALLIFPAYPTWIINVGGEDHYSLLDNAGFRFSFFSLKLEGSLL